MGIRFSNKRSGDGYYRDGWFELALYWYKRGVEKYLQNVGLLVAMARRLFRLRRSDEANQAFYKAIEKKKLLPLYLCFIRKNPVSIPKGREVFITQLRNT